MNKVILGLLVAVCVLGMALIMLNERMRKPEPANPAGIIAPVTSPDAAPPMLATSPPHLLPCICPRRPRVAFLISTPAAKPRPVRPSPALSRRKRAPRQAM